MAQLRSRGWLNYAQEDGSIMLKRMAQLRSIMLKRKINYAQEDGSIMFKRMAQTKDQLRSRGWLNSSRTLYEIP
jgi:hypothetical protein